MKTKFFYKFSIINAKIQKENEYRVLFEMTINFESFLI